MLRDSPKDRECIQNSSLAQHPHSRMFLTHTSVCAPWGDGQLQSDHQDGLGADCL